MGQEPQEFSIRLSTPFYPVNGGLANCSRDLSRMPRPFDPAKNRGGPRESGGIGRRARLRIWCRKAWGFESPLSHFPPWGFAPSSMSQEAGQSPRWAPETLQNAWLLHFDKALLAVRFASPSCVFWGGKLQDSSPEVVLGLQAWMSAPRPHPKRRPTADLAVAAGGEPPPHASGASGNVPAGRPNKRPLLCAEIASLRPHAKTTRTTFARPSASEVRQGCVRRKGGLDRVSSHP